MGNFNALKSIKGEVYFELLHNYFSARKTQS